MLRATVVVLLFSYAALSSAEDSGWVVLPVDEYRALHEKAFRPAPEPEKPAIDSTLTRIDYELRVGKDAATGEARLTIDVFKDGWVRVPIPEGLRVRSARLDGGRVALTPSASGPVLLLVKPGRKVVVLEVAIPLAASAGTESLSLPVGKAAVSRAAITVPRDGLEVKTGGALLANQASAKGETRWIANGTGAAPLSFSWQRRVEDRHVKLPLRARGSVTQLVGLAEDAAQLSAEVRLEVVQGVAATAALAVPEGIVLSRVSGANVADWEVKDGVLTVTFLEAVEKEETILLAGDARIPRDGVLTVPLLRLRGVERETGGVAVEVLGAGEIVDRQVRGLDPADPREIGGTIAERDSPLLEAFRFRAQEAGAARSLAVTVARYTPQAVLLATIEEARYDALVTSEGKTLVRGRYAVRNNQQSFLGVRLPEGATLWSAAVSGRPVRPGRTEDGGLLVPLEKGKAGEETPAFPVEVVYLERAAAWPPEGRLHLRLPTLDLPVARTGLAFYRSPHYRVSLEPGAFREQPYVHPLSPALRTAGVAEATVDERVHGNALPKSAQKLGLRRSGSVPGALPLQVPFPAFGDVLFLVSELTKEGDAPGVDVRYKRTKGGRS